MKRALLCLMCMIILISVTGCNADSNTADLSSGFYYAVGDYKEMLTPYLHIETDENWFAFGSGSIISYAEYGTYEVTNGTIIATSQSTTFQFEIVDRNILALIEIGDKEYEQYFDIPANTQFVFSEDLK